MVSGNALGALEHAKEFPRRPSVQVQEPVRFVELVVGLELARELALRLLLAARGRGQLRGRRRHGGLGPQGRALRRGHDGERAPLELEAFPLDTDPLEHGLQLGDVPAISLLRCRPLLHERGSALPFEPQRAVQALHRPVHLGDVRRRPPGRGRILVAQRLGGLTAEGARRGGHRSRGGRLAGGHRALPQSVAGGADNGAPHLRRAHHAGRVAVAGAEDRKAWARK
mmetsp:Transcript_113095/g.325105  ORF Transcript_113095/g.325105 Transcript_113095/m.325105 type:complete len:226 (-) Transcript_113095:16-693(-)